MVTTALALPLLWARMVAEVLERTCEVVTVNVALVRPSGTTTLSGTLAEALLLERKTPRPPAGAAMQPDRPVDELPPFRSRD